MIAQYAHEDLTKQLGDMADPMMLDPGTAATMPDNYKNWALTPTSIVFFFDPYQVASYAAGPQKVEIPFTSFTSGLAAPFDR